MVSKALRFDSAHLHHVDISSFIVRKKKPRTSLTAARKYKSSIKSPWQGPVVDRNRGSKSNNLPSGAAEYGMISRIIELEKGLDDAIELGIKDN